MQKLEMIESILPTFSEVVQEVLVLEKFAAFVTIFCAIIVFLYVTQ